MISLYTFLTTIWIIACIGKLISRRFTLKEFIQYSVLYHLLWVYVYAVNLTMDQW